MIQELKFKINKALVDNTLEIKRMIKFTLNNYCSQADDIINELCNSVETLNSFLNYDIDHLFSYIINRLRELEEIIEKYNLPDTNNSNKINKSTKINSSKNNKTLDIPKKMDNININNKTQNPKMSYIDNYIKEIKSKNSNIPNIKSKKKEDKINNKNN